MLPATAVMLEILPETRSSLLALRASEWLTAPDYEQVFIPALEEIMRVHGRARVLLYLDGAFRGWEPGALWDDAVFGLRHRHDFEKIAVVGGPAWVDWGVRIGRVLLDGEARTFGANELAEALAWVSDFPAAHPEAGGGDQLEFEFDESSLILTVRPKGRLKKEHFLELRRQVDPVIREQGALNGIIIVTGSFPGWEDLAAMLSHLEFVHDHHRKVAKVALVTKDEMIRFASRIARHFVRAEIERFDDENAALWWIKGGN